MKLGPVTKLDKRYKTTSQKFDYNFMSANCDVIVIFPIYAQFIAQIIINSDHLSYKQLKTELKIL